MAADRKLCVTRSTKHKTQKSHPNITQTTKVLKTHYEHILPRFCLGIDLVEPVDHDRHGECQQHETAQHGDHRNAACGKRCGGDVTVAHGR